MRRQTLHRSLIVFVFSFSTWAVQSNNLAWAQTSSPAWHMICDKLGRYHTGYYTEYGVVYSQVVLVGDLATGCYGRCGVGCGSDGRGPYTQECLNHDVCVVFASDRRHCSSEAKLAASGFFNASACP